MNGGIFFIGGASGAGKSTVSQKLSQLFSMAVIELDDFQRLIMPAITDSESRWTATRGLTVEVVRQLMSARATCLVEGAWIEPKQADELRIETQGQFFPVFCGYTGMGLEERHKAIKNNGVHWTTREPEEQTWLFLEKQVTDSEELQRACATFQIPYFDFTDFAKGSRNLQKHFEQWLKQ